MNNEIIKFIGLEYKLNGRSFDGVDCYGISYLYNKEVLNRELPLNVDIEIKKNKTMREVFEENFHKFEKTTRPKEGDLMIFKMPDSTYHVGVYLNGVKFLHILKENTFSCLVDHRDIKYKSNFKYYAKYK